ncbi:Prostaglandin reductase-3, partial [Globisporangium polare]
MPPFKRLEVHTLSSDFRKATRIVEGSELPKAHAGHVVVKNHYVGINATDVNIT